MYITLVSIVDLKGFVYLCITNSVANIYGKKYVSNLIIIKCMCSRCRRDDIHVCFAYASPQRMPHMYDHKIVSLKYII